MRFRSLAVSLAALALATPAFAQHGHTLVLTGTVKDPTGRPIEQAEVAVQGTNLTQRTGVDGGFRFDSVPEGRRWVLVRRLGFEPAQYAMTLERGKNRELAAELEPLPQTLPAKVIAARSGYTGRYADFYRRQRSGWGKFITRDDIDRERPPELGWMVLRYLPFIDPRSMDEAPFPRAGFGSWPAAAYGRSPGFRVCPPAISVNGAAPSSAWTVNSFRPNDVEAVEVYRPTISNVPVEYSMYPGTECGLVVVWLR